MFAACPEGDFACVEMLLKCKADPSARTTTPDGETPLLMACDDGGTLSIVRFPFVSAAPAVSICTCMHCGSMCMRLHLSLSVHMGLLRQIMALFKLPVFIINCHC